jgi:CP family cyanate transporter-like MFS transporter
VPSYILSLILLWLAGNALRLTILAVPPVIPAINQQLGLSATGVGILGGLPVLLFAFAALPGALLIARLGPVRALVVGLLLTAAGGALRGAVPSVAWLYAMTIVMAAGVAIMQPAMPALVRRWTPQRIGFATAVYTNGLLVGETVPVGLMFPLVLPLVDNSWPLALAVWSIPVALIAVMVMIWGGSNAPAGPNAAPAAPARWWPDWKDGLIWRLGLIFGAVNAMYFGANTFLPDYLTHFGRPDLIGPALTAVNFGQLPASIILLMMASRLERKVWPYIAFGVVALVSIGGLMLTPDVWTVVHAALLGFACAGVLVLALAVPPLLRPPADVARISAAVFTISYSLGMITAVVGGVLWDLTGVPASAFVPIGLCAALILFLPATIRFHESGAGALARAK